MYEYRYAVGRYRNYQPGLHHVDINEYKLSDVVNAFSLLDIVIYDTFYKRLVRITLDDYYDKFANYSDTIVAFLKANGNNLLNYHTDIPTATEKYARWETITDKMFCLHPGFAGLSNDSQNLLLADSAPDIRIIRDGYEYSDYKNLVDYSLYIVNGCFTRAYGNSEAIYLLGAGKDYQTLKNDVYVSVINFQQLGKIQTLPITKTMINRIKENGSNRFLLSLDKDLNIGNKTVWMVFNGRLCVDDDVIKHIGGNVLQFSPEYIDMMMHYLTYKEFTRTPVWTDQSKRDEYVEASLVMDNSFIVIIDNPTIGVTVEPLITYPWPSVAISDSTFSHPVMIENGLFPYLMRKSYGFNQREITFDVHHMYKPVIDSTGALTSNLIYGTVNQGKMGKLPRAYDFKITGIGYE